MPLRATPSCCSGLTGRYSCSGDRIRVPLQPRTGRTFFLEAAPVWLRLVRRGNQFTGYFSANGTSWTTAGTATINMAATAYVGLAVTSRMDSELSRATFTNLQVSAGAGTTTLPAPWTSRDLGSPALAGSASAAGGTFTVAAGGINIWGTSDQFHFVYQPLQGDVEVIARVASLHDVDPFSKAGVMIRETLTRGSRHASMMATGTEGWVFPRRRATGGTSDRSPYRAGAAPGWVRIVREGNLFSGYTSTDGTTWSLVDTETVAMASTVYVGLAVTSHDPGARATATFTNVTARRLTTGTNQPPTVSITSPSAGATFNAPASITVTATARDTDGTIAKVAFYRGSTLLGSDTSGSSQNGYTYTWTNVGAGSYQLTAVATDNDGDTTAVCGGHRDGQLADQPGADGRVHPSGAELDLHRPREHHPRREGERHRWHDREGRLLSRLDAAQVGYEQEQPKRIYL